MFKIPVSRMLSLEIDALHPYSSLALGTNWLVWAFSSEKDTTTKRTGYFELARDSHNRLLRTELE